MMIVNAILMVVVAFSLLVMVLDVLFFSRHRVEKMRWVASCEFGLILATVILLLRYYNFEVVLTAVVLASGVICVLDYLLFARIRRRRMERLQASHALSKEQKEGLRKWPVIIDYSRSFFPVLLAVLLLRSFAYEPFRIPSGSLEPTLLVGDFIVVNKYTYGLRLPVTNTKIWSFHEPKRGDIVVFHWPVNARYDFIKRVIGLPGDTIRYQDKVLYVNGKEMKQTVQSHFDYQPLAGTSLAATKSTEDLTGVKHGIYRIPSRSAYTLTDIVVPKDMYFVMGDNRDDSEDSRFWGFVPEKDLVGKASMIWMSFNKRHFGIRWHRIGDKII
jgi:signal peptidase I